VRGELSVLAHADSQLAEYSVPPLTAVRMPLGELGAEAVTALVVQIQTGASQDVLVGAAPRLEVRASTSRPLTKPVRAFGPRSGVAVGPQCVLGHLPENAIAAISGLRPDSRHSARSAPN
jgi:hypothetical protein